MNFYHLIQGDASKVLPSLKGNLVTFIFSDSPTDPANPVPINDYHQFYQNLISEYLRIGKSTVVIGQTVSQVFKIHRETIGELYPSKFKHLQTLLFHGGELLCASNHPFQVDSEALKDLDAYVPKQRQRHTAERPVKLMEAILKLFTAKGDWVLDPFAGSGTTIEAAKNLERNCVAIEFETAFCALIRKRCQSFPNFKFEVYK